MWKKETYMKGEPDGLRKTKVRTRERSTAISHYTHQSSSDLRS
jgi:hypothetical protein